MKLSLFLVIVIFSCGFAQKFFDERFNGAKCMEEHPRYSESLMSIKQNCPSPRGPRRYRSFNGQPAKIEDFFYEVLLFMFDSNYGSWFYCSGTIVRHNWVLTTAHCVEGFSEIVVVAGITDLVNGPYSFMTNITNSDHMIVHPDFDEDLLQNDIGMIFMEDAPKNLFSEHFYGVGLAELPEEPLNVTSAIGVLSGFGRINDATLSESLRYVEVGIISNARCSEIFGPTISDGHLCTSYGACAGDSGSPLVLKNTTNSEHKVLVGITSFGNAFGCSSGYPTGLTRVSFYLDWIKENFQLLPKPRRRKYLGMKMVLVKVPKSDQHQ